MNPLYRKTFYLISSPKLDGAPFDHGYEVAFAGRSNAGKSSAINAITQQKSLARTSKTPGRTQMLNFFQIDAERRLVDLPGYGYAKVPDAVKKNWQISMEVYLQQRQSLRGVFLLMDIRHPLTDFDWQMIEWCRHHDKNLHIALTKADKLSHGAAKNTLIKIRSELKSLDSLTLQLFSVPAKIGIEEAHALLDRWLDLDIAS